MDFISTTLVTLNEPSGFWTSILNAFKNGMGTYILAVIVLALIVRVVFSLVDIVNKKMNMKNSEINAKMKPELEAVQKKYGHDQRLLQQKQSEIYKKYQFNMMGSCFPMLITMILQFTVFLTLWNSLQAVSNFNIANQYQNMKNIYANVISLNENTTVLDTSDFEDGDKIAVELFTNEDDGKQYLKLKLSKDDGQNYTDIGEVLYDDKMAEANSSVSGLLDTYVISTVKNEAGKDVASTNYHPTVFSEELKLAAENAVKTYFLENKEGFLWIKNIYKAESPTSPMFTKDEIKSYLSSFYSDAEKEEEKTKDFEGKIFDCIIENNSQLESIQNEKNGFYILTIIAVLTSFLSLWLSNLLMRNKNQPAQKQSWGMYVIMPLIIGIFTFMYTSLFAIYLIVGQIAMLALTPLTTFLVKKWTKHDEDKKRDKTIVDVDYRRKDA